MSLPFDQIAFVDFETFFDSVYTLKKMPMTEYIRDERFEAQTCAIKIDNGPSLEIGDLINHDTAAYIGFDRIADALHEIDWSRTAFCGHHAQFDGLIATHHFGVYPAFWLDTLSMARLVYGVDSSHALGPLCERLGRPGKVHAQALKDVQGVRLKDMTDEQRSALAEYNMDDAEDTAFVFSKLRPFVPEEELRVIDMTVRMYAEPVLLIDKERVQRAFEAERARKAALYASAGLDVKEMASSDKFAEHLKALGVEPPTKISLRTQKRTWAFSKQDIEFKVLLQHPDERVRNLVEARLASKSTLVETRAKTMAGRAGLPTPIYLNYFGARTGRWSGGDGANYQNLPKKGIGFDLRRSLCAPPGTALVISDASQIEARMLAWDAGQQDVLQAFASGDDVYALDATNMYGRLINAEDNPNERQVGKTFRLGAGFGAGGRKINYMMKIGAIGPPIVQPLEETEALIAAWRAANGDIVRYWNEAYDCAVTAFMNRQQVPFRSVCFEGTARGGYIHLPNETRLFYPGVHWTDTDCTKGSGMAYVGRNGTVNFWRGIVVENIIQALARVVLAHQLVQMEDELDEVRIATTTHDEVIAVVPEREADDYAHAINRIMSTSPSWARSLPLSAKTQVSSIYEKH